MPLPEAIGLFSGEFATLQSSSTLDPAKQVYVVGIRKKAATLKVLRAIPNERRDYKPESDATFLRISQGGMASAAGTASSEVLSPGGDSRCHRRFCADESVRENLASAITTPGESTLECRQRGKKRARNFPRPSTGCELLRLSENRLDRCEEAVDGRIRKHRHRKEPTRSRARCFCRCPERFGSASVSSSPAYDCQRIVERRAGYAL